jgi:hypothetical protein
LRNLILRENNINKIDFIDGLNYLSYLDLSNNVLRTVDRSNIGFLPNLKTLICGENYLKNVNAFNKLNTLFYISFENNKINDFTQVDKLNEIECLREINLNGNPISKEYSYRQNMVKRFLKLGKIDSQEITNEEREIIFLELQGLTDTDGTADIYNLPTLKENKKDSNMKVKYVNLGLFTGITPKNSSVSTQEPQIIYQSAKHSVNLGLPVISTVKNQQQLERKYFRNLSMQPNNKHKKFIPQQEIYLSKNDLHKQPNEEFLKKYLLKREIANEFLRKGLRPMSNKYNKN